MPNSVLLCRFRAQHICSNELGLRVALSCAANFILGLGTEPIGVRDGIEALCLIPWRVGAIRHARSLCACIERPSIIRGAQAPGSGRLACFRLDLG
jgi:hypothetical protein